MIISKIAAMNNSIFVHQLQFDPSLVTYKAKNIDKTLNFRIYMVEKRKFST